MACEIAIDTKTIQLSAIINLVHRLTEAEDTTRIDVIQYPILKTPPQANCERYDCSGLIEPDTLIRDNIYQLLRCRNGTKTNEQTVF